jgi:hypothetical protein
MVDLSLLVDDQGREATIPSCSRRRQSLAASHRRFGHDATVRHLNYDFIYNHDFILGDAPTAEGEVGDAKAKEQKDGEANEQDGKGQIEILNYDFVKSGYGAKIHRAVKIVSGTFPTILFVVATPATMHGTGYKVEVPDSSSVVMESVRRGIRALQSAYGGAPAVIGAVILVGPDQRCHANDQVSNSGEEGSVGSVAGAAGAASDWLSERPGELPIAVGRLSQKALELSYRYGHRPMPERGELFNEVYTSFVRLSKMLTATSTTASAATSTATSTATTEDGGANKQECSKECSTECSKERSQDYAWPEWEDTNFFKLMAKAQRRWEKQFAARAAARAMEKSSKSFCSEAKAAKAAEAAGACGEGVQACGKAAGGSGGTDNPSSNPFTWIQQSVYMAAVQDLQREHGSSWAGVPAKAKQQLIAERVGTLCVAKGGLGKGKGEACGEAAEDGMPGCIGFDDPPPVQEETQRSVGAGAVGAGAVGAGVGAGAGAGVDAVEVAGVLLKLSVNVKGNGGAVHAPALKFGGGDGGGGDATNKDHATWVGGGLLSCLVRGVPTKQATPSSKSKGGQQPKPRNWVAPPPSATYSGHF